MKAALIAELSGKVTVADGEVRDAVTEALGRHVRYVCTRVGCRDRHDDCEACGPGSGWPCEVAELARALDAANARLAAVRGMAESRAISDRTLGRDPRFALDLLAILDA